MPSFNSGPFIERAVRSALDQNGVRLEVLVQDAGSTDGTLETLASVSDPRVSWISEADSGQSDALNRALNRARGEFVMWLNADDLIVPGAVSLLTRVARGSGLDAVHGNFEIIDENGAPIKAYSSAPLERKRLIRHPTYIFSGALIVRRSLLLKVGGFDSTLHYCMDYDLFLRIAQASRCTGNVPNVVARFRRQSASKTESAFLPFLRERLIIQHRHGASAKDHARSSARFIAYRALRPLWRSRLWLSVRPSKHLGGA